MAPAAVQAPQSRASTLVQIRSLGAASLRIVHLLDFIRPMPPVAILLRLLALVALALPVVEAWTADAAAIAAYSGADREQYLLRGARNEGALTLYTNIAPWDIGKLAAEF